MINRNLVLIVLAKVHPTKMSISTNKSIKINVIVTNSIRTVLPPTNSIEILKVRTGCQGMSAMIPRDCDASSTILAKQVIIVIFWVATEGHIDVVRKYQDLGL